VTAFVDTSVWFAAVVARDRNSARARAVLEAIDQPLTTDHVIVETWLLLNRSSIAAGQTNSGKAFDTAVFEWSW
jgi:predicted nucleic acid-binding protein